jgi:hypothetical protein
MSFEGYYQQLCRLGHLTHRDCYDAQLPCEDCGDLIMWEALVDDTNCDSYGLIVPKDWDAHFLSEAPTLEDAEPRYRPPTQEELKHYVTHYDSYYRCCVYTNRKPVEFATEPNMEVFR